MALFDRFEKFLDAVIPPSDDVADAVARGRALLDAGDAEGALAAADVALQQAPGYLRAAVLRSDALAAQGNRYDALAALETAARVRPLPPAVLARAAELAASVGDEKQSLEYEAHARARLRGQGDPEVGKRLLAAARTLIAHRAEATGLRLARGATLADPHNGAAWLILARDALSRMDRERARHALERGLVALDPSDGPANRTAGEVALGLGDFPLAVRHLRRAWILGDEGALVPLLTAAFRAGDRQVLERVLAGAEGELARVGRAVVALGSGDPTTARATLDGVQGGEVPEALWAFALETALGAARELAERWAREAPERPGATAVTGLATAHALLAAGDALGARAALVPSLAHPRTREAALGLYREACRAGWRGNLGALLEELAAVARDHAAVAQAEGELRARRRELDEPLRVALMGEFSAGKSTFLNALVGQAVSPMGVLPTTAQVHWLRFGDEPQARIVDVRGGAVIATVAEAPRVVERRRAEGVATDYVEVTLPIARLARVELIDTPGFNAGESSHEAAVRRAFDIADVALWLFDARQAGKASETGPLAEAKSAGLPVVGVLNKLDQVPPGERARLMKLLREGFRELAPCVLGFSARHALAAVLALQKADATPEERAAAEDKLRASGWEALLGYLDAHLVEQRAAWKQLRVARRARGIVSAALEAVVREEERARQEARRDVVLLGAVAALRESLLSALGALRREVDAALREQLRGLTTNTRPRADETNVDHEVLLRDAVAEIGYRARARALEGLAPRMRDVEKLGVQAELVGDVAAPLLTAGIVGSLDQAVAEGVRDAVAAAVLKRGNVPLPGAELATSLTYAPSDPLASLEAVVARREHAAHHDDDDSAAETLRIALEVAGEVLAGFEAPALPLPEPPA